MFSACEIVLWFLKVAKRKSCFMVSQGELYQGSSRNTLMATACSVSDQQTRKCLRSGTFVGHDLMNDYSGPHEWPAMSGSCFEMRCLCSYILQCFCTSFKGPSMWKQCGSAPPRAGRRCHRTGQRREDRLLFQGLPLFLCFDSPLKCVLHIVNSGRRFWC